MATILFSEDFEGEFPSWDGSGEMMIREGWRPAFLHDPDNNTKLNRPEWKQAGMPQCLGGSGAQAIHNSHATSDGAIVKQFATIPGNTYRASVWAMGLSNPGARMGMQILIDLTGGENYGGEFPTIESPWFDDNDPDDPLPQGQYKFLTTPKFVAQANKITVYLRAVTNEAIPANAHFDNFLFELVEGDPGPDPELPEGLSGVILRLQEAAGMLDNEASVIGEIATILPDICTGGCSPAAVELITQAVDLLSQAVGLM